MIRRARQQAPGWVGGARIGGSRPLPGHGPVVAARVPVTGRAGRGRSTRAGYLAKSRHHMLPAPWRHSPTANPISRRGPGQQPEVITAELTTAITGRSFRLRSCRCWPSWSIRHLVPQGVQPQPQPQPGLARVTAGLVHHSPLAARSADLRGWLVIVPGDDVCGFWFFPRRNSPA